MKKKLVLITSVLVLAVASAAMAAGLTQETGTTIETAFVPSYDKLASFMGYSTDEKFDLFHKTAVFMGKYCTTNESFSFVEDMIISGCDPQTTMDIYQFYLTTNEPISIVKQIYDMVYNGEPIVNRDIVFETAFNAITNNKCGVLTEDDVIFYLESGLTIEDIQQANLLSRRGVLTIQKILTERISGTSWEKIVETISDEKISSSYKNADSTTLTRALNISSVTNQPINTVLSNENSDEYFSSKTKEVNTILKSKGYWRGKQSENFEKIALNAKEKGISSSKLVALMNQGFSEVEIVNMLNDPSCSDATIDSIAKDEVSK
ncbi:MAG: hypothetical protein IJ297_06330 [Clostridia bacterium]|nr:hypothetical protein [Clostridia bacterium]